MADVLTIEHDGYGPAVVTLDIDDDTNFVIHDYTIQAAEPDIIYHVPDEGETRLIRIEDGDRIAQITVTVKGTSRDVLDNNINDLRLALRNSTRHELDNAHQQYRLKTQPDGASNATYHNIKAGWLDDGQSHFEIVSKKNIIAYHTLITLILSPYGYQSAITLMNDLASSPHFLEDSNSDGLADGWNERGTITTSINSDNFLIGHQCQQVEAGASATAHGIYSDTVSATHSFNVSGFAWIQMAVSGDQITVYIKDGSNAVIDSATISPGNTSNADLSIVSDGGGDTWYRVPVSGTSIASNDCYLEITRAAADGSAGHTFRVDGCYLNVTTGAIPTNYGWISSKRTENNNSLDTEAEINYLDVWGIPGDADAVAFWKPEAQAIGLGFYMGRVIDGKVRASEQVHWLDSAGGTGTNGSGAWTTSANAAYAGGSVARFTEGAGATGGYFEWTFSGDDARNFARTPRVVVLIGHVGSAGALDGTFLLGAYADGTNFASHNTTHSFTAQSGTTVYALNLGTINLVGVLPDDVPDTAEPDLTLRITIAGLANGEIANIDAVCMLPVVEDYMVMHITDGSAWAASDLWINGHTKQVYPEARGFDRHDWQGSMWTLAPGQTMNRIISLQFFNTTDYDVNYDAGFNWKLEVTPRGRHLIGSR